MGLAPMFNISSVGKTLDPIRLMARRRRLRAAVQDEVYYLRRAHGRAALAAAMEKLHRPDLTSWGRRIMKDTIKQLAD